MVFLLDPPLRDPAAQVSESLARSSETVDGDEPSHGQALRQDGAEIRWACDCPFVVVGRDQPAQCHSAVAIKAGEHRIHDRAADILEIYVDAVRTDAVERLGSGLIART